MLLTRLVSSKMVVRGLALTGLCLFGVSVVVLVVGFFLTIRMLQIHVYQQTRQASSSIASPSLTTVPMLITPVRGSVDAYLSHLPPAPTRCVATLISRAASFTSSTFTSASSRIFANASANRIIDSNCRGVAVITLLATAFAPCARIFTYSSSSCAAASSEIRGFTNFLAYAT